MSKMQFCNKTNSKIMSKSSLLDWNYLFFEEIQNDTTV